MCQKESQTNHLTTSMHTTRERLTFALVLLFLIVLLTAVFLPQSAAGDMLPYPAGLLVLAIRFYYGKQHQK